MAVAIQRYETGLELTDSDFRWLAGVLDTEGSLILQKTQNKRWPTSPNKFIYTPRIKVAMTGKEFIDYLHRLFGGNRCFATKKGNRKLQWKWEVNGRSIIKLIPKLMPHLLLKGRQAELLLEAAKLNYERGLEKSKNWKNGRILVLLPHGERLEEIYWEIRNLNHRGVE